MAPSLPAELLPAVLGGHSTEPYWVAIPLIGFALIMRVMRGGGRRGGPWQRGPSGGGGGGRGGNDPPVQWDIRKAPEPEATPDASSEEQNPPSDL